MCRSPLHPFLHALPKCEHHMHLEGSLSPSLLFTLASRNNVTLPPPTADSSFASPSALLERYTRFASLDDFLHYYYIGMSCLIHRQDFELLAWEYFQKAKDDGVVHAEVFFDPQAHTGRGVAYETVVQGFTSACERAETELGLSTRLILCFLRHLPVQDSLEMYATAEKDLKSRLLAGIGLDSSEKGNEPGKWKHIYGRAKEAGIRRTAHAGEEGPVEYIKEALSALDVQRIDHGIRLAEDKQLMREVAERGILVTMCPLSNVRLRCVSSVSELPVRQFLDAGVHFSINSDDPAYFGGYIQDNYCAVQEAFNLSIRDWESIAKASAECSWWDKESQNTIMKQIEDVVKQYT